MNGLSLNNRHETARRETRDKGPLSLSKGVPCPEVPCPESKE
jgi:hypothetical protein